MILNLTQHRPTACQIEAGVIDLPQSQQEVLRALLTFDTLPTSLEIVSRANQIADLCITFIPEGMKIHCDWAMVGGAPYLMGPLASALDLRQVKAVFSFTERRSVEETLPDGSVKKSSIFAHMGWVHAPDWVATSNGCMCGCA